MKRTFLSFTSCDILHDARCAPPLRLFGFVTFLRLIRSLDALTCSQLLVKDILRVSRTT